MVRMLPVIIVDYAIKCPGGTVYFEVRLPAGRGGGGGGNKKMLYIPKC